MFTSQNPNPNARRTFVLFRPFVAVWHWLFPPTLAHRDRQSSSSRVVAAVAVIAFCVGIVAAAFFSARPVYNRYQTWQAGRKVSRAAELEKQDRWLEAWILANEAYVLAPDHPDVIRTLARYYTMRGQTKEAFYLLNKLEKLHIAQTDDDRLLRIQALTHANEIKDAQQQIEEFLKTSPPTPRMVEIADQVMQQRGRTRQLLEILRAYVALKPEDQDIRMKLATREIQFGTPAEIADGTNILWELGAEPTKAGLGALEFLDQQKIEDADEQRKLIDLLQKHPLAGEEQRIAALRRLVKLEPARKSEIIEKAIADRKQASREDLVPLASWLVQEGEHERLLKFLKKEMVQDYGPLLAEYLNALMLAKRNEDLEALVQDPRTRLSVSIRAYYRAHLAFVTKKSWDQVNTLLVDALAAAQSDVQPLNFLMIARWSELHGHPKIAEQAYRAASVNHSSEQIQRVGYEKLLNLTYLNGNSAGYLEAARNTARRWPENQHFQEQSLYATLLSGIELEVAVPQIQKLLDAKPDDSQFKLLMGLAHYRMLDSKAAMKYINHINLSDLSPGRAAVLCGILYDAGDKAVNPQMKELSGKRDMEKSMLWTEQARSLAQQISRDVPMLPEERKFLQEVRPDLAAASGPAQPGQP